MKKYNKILEAIQKGINIALDDFENEEIQSQKVSQFKDDNLTKNTLDLINGIDLGLPSGTKWCKYNLGVNPNKLSKPEDWYGNYYAWGELNPNPKNIYNWDTYKWGYNSYGYGYSSNYNIYKLKELLLEDDAAYQTNIDDTVKFKIPNKVQVEELLEYTTDKWVENYNNIKGLNGILFISKLNNNFLFIPANGEYNQFHEDILQYDSKYVNIWTSTLYETSASNDAWFLQSTNKDDNSHMHKNTNIYRTNRCCGLGIRPIILNEYEEI